MATWSQMFEAAQTLVQNSPDWRTGIARTIAFARQNPAIYAADYWQSVSADDLPIDVVTSWAVAGFECLERYEGGAVAILDCGDCPDVFRLAEGRFSSETSLEAFRSFSKTDALRSGEEFPGITSISEVAYHHVRELTHPILNWSGHDYHGDDGYLLWLSVATLALLEPLRDLAFCKRILRGRSEIILMSGFEEIFFYVGTISAAGYSRE
ncbi:MAG: hypothetical protein ABI700_03245 [Chloroflexota bacterium]